jgi:hypothetical protein
MFLNLSDILPSSLEAQARALTLGSATFDSDLTTLEKAASSAVAVPVLAAIASLRSAQDKAKPLADLVTATHYEDAATAEDRFRNEDLIDRRIDQLASDIKAWNAERSGVWGGTKVLWERVTGGADLSSFTKTNDAVMSMINAKPLTQEGRDRISQRLAQVMATINPGDWRYLIAVGVGLLVWNAAKAKASAIAQEKAAQVAKKLHKRIKKRFKKPKPKE